MAGIQSDLEDADGSVKKHLVKFFHAASIHNELVANNLEKQDGDVGVDSNKEEGDGVEADMPEHSAQKENKANDKRDIHNNCVRISTLALDQQIQFGRFHLQINDSKCIDKNKF